MSNDHDVPEPTPIESSGSKTASSSTDGASARTSGSGVWICGAAVVGLLLLGTCLWLFRDAWRLSGDVGPVSQGAATRSSFSLGPKQSGDAWGSVQGSILIGGRAVSDSGFVPGLTNIVVYLVYQKPVPDADGHETDRDQTLGGDQKAEAVPVAALEHPADGDELEREPAVLDQVEMTFVPHVVTVQAGHVLELRNSDSALHNVHGITTLNAPFNIALQPGGTDHLTFRRAEFIRVACHLHSRMSAWIAVMPTSWFTKVDGNGDFSLGSVPPGSYELVGWRESDYPPYTPKRVSLKVEVHAGCATQVQLNLPE